MRMETKEVLEKARTLIESAPYLSYNVFESDNCYCTVGAILKVLEPNAVMVELGNDDSYRNSYGCALSLHRHDESILTIIKSFGAIDVYDLFELNDKSTKEEVLEKFDHAISLLEK